MSNETDDGTAALEAALEEARARLASSRELKRALFDESPEGICILARDGQLELNHVAEVVLGAVEEQDDDWQDTWGFFELDGRRLDAQELPGFIAMSGKAITGHTVRCRAPELPDEVILCIDARPLADGRSISVFRDVTERTRMEVELHERGRRLAEGEEENRQLVERLRLAIDEVATPVLRVAKDVLVMPIIGILDAARSERAAERLLQEVSVSGARWVIIDVTGVELIDTTTADLFAKLTKAVELLGCRTSISGVRPSVARTMVDIGFSWEGLESHRNLRHALEAALAEARRERRRGRASRREVKA